MSADTGVEYRENLGCKGHRDPDFPEIAEFKAPRDLGKYFSCRFVQTSTTQPIFNLPIALDGYDPCSHVLTSSSLLVNIVIGARPDSGKLVRALLARVSGSASNSTWAYGQSLL
jgi:hypothetical protein